ncbi:MAG: hypothetical protein CSA62_13125 [Planctomycetota bacterium]|nr:MAG: hypothetical protein CSA62_13125 [Planctomycetota bacterium]
MPDQHLAAEFQQTAALHRTRVALAWSNGSVYRTWTYQDLAGQVGQLAHTLDSEGVQRGDIVGLVANRHPEVVTAMLALWELGAAFVPISPKDPPARRAKMLEISGAIGHLTFDPRPQLQRIEARPSSTTQTAPRTGGEQLAYAMFTSGSSGTPKAVAVPHRAILRLVSEQDYLPFGPELSFLQAAPMSFDASVLELWGPLLHGGRCVLYPEHDLPTARGLRQIIESQQINTAWLTASLFNSVIDDDASCLSGLRYLLVGGEALSPSHVRRALAALPETQLINGYGPTENTTFTTCYPIPRGFSENEKRVPIGWPLRGTSVRVVDSSLQPVGRGEEGELLVMGQGLAHGYLGAPDRDNERFVTTEDDSGELVRAYRTGDLVFERPDGAFEFVGRIDEQVKIAGFRIEPSECEAVIATAPDVQHCKVICREDPAKRLRLIAYLVCPEFALARARQLAAERLPQQLLPHNWVRLEAMPHTSNGKLDVDRLPSPWCKAPRHELPAASPGLRTVLRCWSEVLGEAPAGVDLGLFETGGRSIDALRLQTCLEQACGRELEPTFVFEFVTVRRQAEELLSRGVQFEADTTAPAPQPGQSS